MTFNELIAICDPVKVSGPEPETIGGLAQDSRAAGMDSVFIAIEGTRLNGHLFIKDAIDNGARVVICEEPMQAVENVCIIKVDNTRSLIGPLAQAFEGNPGKKLRTVGITGTNGKTTVATLTYQVLQKLGARPSLLGTVAKRIDDEILDSRLTTADPIELARDMHRMVKANSGFLAMEVSSHALDQQRVNGIDFEVAAFTNLSQDHLDYHASVKAYATAKKRLFDGLKPQATAVINADDEQSDFIGRDCTADVVFFGFKSNKGISCSLTQNNHQGLRLKVDGFEIKSPLVGRFNAYNVAQTFLICRTLGFDDISVAKALHNATGATGRLQRVQPRNQPDQPLVLVDYAHSPDALENVLQSLQSIKDPQQTLHVIFGCGGDRDKTKRPKMAAAAEKYADYVTVTSDNPRSEEPDAIIDDTMKGFAHPEDITRITDRRQAIERAVARANEHTIILIAGKGHETYQEIKGKSYPFDDRKIARQALARHNANPQIPGVD